MTTISCKDSAEVSCIIGNILAELEQPCQSCQPDGAVVLTGRSPNSDANNAYYVNTDGTLNNNNVYNANFAARPALMEYRVQVARRRKQRTIIKGGHILSSVRARTGDKHMTGDADGLATGESPGHPRGGRYRRLSALCPACAPSRPSKDGRTYDF